MIFYSRILILVPSFALIGTHITSPPNSYGTKLCVARSSKTLSTSAAGLSILLIATNIGILSDLAISITSTVYGCTLSIAETTKIMRSVTLAPLSLKF